MPLSAKMLAELNAAQIPFEEMATACSEDRAIVDIVKLCIRDPLQPEIVIGYHVTINSFGSERVIDELIQCIKENMDGDILAEEGF